MLVVVLTGVSDPSPEVLTVPWSYLAAVTVATLAALSAAAVLAVRPTRCSPISVVRQL
jgi:hypothetical protein